MRIKDLLDPRSIRLNGSAENKDDAIAQIVDLMTASGKIENRNVYFEGVRAREQEATTAVGDGVAIPHCRSSSVKAPGLAAMTIADGVNYAAPDGEKVKLLFLIAAPDTKDNIHVDVLSKLSTLLLDENLIKNLLAAKSAKEFISIVDKAETEKDAESGTKTVVMNAKAKLLAVTACPTGIAHTYMAAETLEKTAVRMGCSMKVETRGASGTKNALTAKEIAEADCIIIAADTKVPMDRFDGKKVIQCKVADGINKAEKIIEEAMSGKVAQYHAEKTVSDTSGTYGKESTGHVIYKHLMNGVSYMLPFVVGG
ncbi:MAG: fructose PTS transporter subunit IIA, partial [Treponema sp.]|nr:fructose PTS transporter subunit IIA [Treponema sp.]